MYYCIGMNSPSVPSYPSSSPKYAGIASELRRRVRGMQPGEKLDSVRRLMQQFEASQATIYSALDVLKGEGLLVGQQGRGLRVPERSGSEVANVLLMVAERATSPFHQRLVFELSQRGRRHRIRFMVEPFSPADVAGESWPPREVRAGLWIPGRSVITPEFVSAWRSRHLPLVVMNRDLREIGVDSVDTDHYRGGKLAARHLIDLGHRALGVIQHQPQSLSLIKRAQGFVDAANDAGAHVVVHASSQPLDGPAIASFVKYSFKSQPAVTALFAMTHSSALAANQALDEIGVVVPDHVSLLGYDHMGQLSRPNLSTIDQSIESMAEAACDMLRARLDRDDRPVMHHIDKLTLVARDSTSPPASEGRA